MNKRSILFATAIATIGLALPAAADSLPEAKSLPKNVVRISPVIPGMGEHWADPKDLPLGPIYGVHDGKVIFLEFMISREDFMNNKSYTELASKAGIKLPSIDHVDIDAEPKGHEGFTVPHFDIHMYFVPHKVHMAIRPKA